MKHMLTGDALIYIVKSSGQQPATEPVASETTLLTSVSKQARVMTTEAGDMVFNETETSSEDSSSSDSSSSSEDSSEDSTSQDSSKDRWGVEAVKQAYERHQQESSSEEGSGEETAAKVMIADVPSSQPTVITDPTGMTIIMPLPPDDDPSRPPSLLPVVIDHTPPSDCGTVQPLSTETQDIISPPMMFHDSPVMPHDSPMMPHLEKEAVIRDDDVSSDVGFTLNDASGDEQPIHQNKETEAEEEKKSTTESIEEERKSKTESVEGVSVGSSKAPSEEDSKRDSALEPATNDDQEIEAPPPLQDEVPPPSQDDQEIEVPPPSQDDQEIEVPPPSQEIEVPSPSQDDQEIEVPPPSQDDQEIEVPPPSQEIEVPSPSQDDQEIQALPPSHDAITMPHGDGSTDEGLHDDVRDEPDGREPEIDMMKQEEEAAVKSEEDTVRDSLGESAFINIEQSMMELQQSIENFQQK